jgi:hypothetical protein
MATSESTDPTGQPSDAPLSRLRGNTVDVDVRRLGQVVVGLCLLALLVLVIVFTIAGVQKNSQINSLRHNGTRITVTVSSCTSLMGGSGSNLVGDSCAGTFAIDGHRYTENIPGTALRTIGSSLPAVVVPTDPALLSPVTILAGEHTSWKVFILPAVLLAALALLGGAILLRHRHRAAAAP